MATYSTITIRPACGKYEAALLRSELVPPPPGHVNRLMQHASGKWMVACCKVVGCELLISHFVDAKPKKERERWCGSSLLGP